MLMLNIKELTACLDRHATAMNRLSRAMEQPRPEQHSPAPYAWDERVRSGEISIVGGVVRDSAGQGWHVTDREGNVLECSTPDRLSSVTYKIHEVRPVHPTAVGQRVRVVSADACEATALGPISGTVTAVESGGWFRLDSAPGALFRAADLMLLAEQPAEQPSAAPFALDPAGEFKIADVDGWTHTVTITAEQRAGFKCEMCDAEIDAWPVLVKDGKRVCGKCFRWFADPPAEQPDLRAICPKCGKGTMRCADPDPAYPSVCDRCWHREPAPADLRAKVEALLNANCDDPAALELACRAALTAHDENDDPWQAVYGALEVQHG